ncbi:MAG: hypothetical protein ACQEP9_09290, partial [Bacillota bacterium]
DFQNTIEDKSLRGINYQKTIQNSNDFLAYTSVSGKADRGAKVTLYLNGEKYRSKKLKEEKKYKFKQINLKKKRLNKIEVIVDNKNDKQIKREKKVLGSPKLYEMGRKELELIAGLYKEKEVDKWDGRVIGYKHNAAISKDKTFNYELLANSKENNQSQYVVSDLGLVAKTTNNILTDADWYLTRGENMWQQGGQSSLLYCFEDGYLEGEGYYIPEQFSDRLSRKSGKGLILTEDYNFNDKQNLNTEVTYNHPDVSSNKQYNLQTEVEYSQGDIWEGITSLGFQFNKNRFAYSDDIASEEYVKKNKYGLIFAHNKLGQDFRTKGKLALFNKKTNLGGNKEENHKKINIQTDIYNKPLSSVLIRNESELDGKRDFSNLTLETNSKVKFSFIKDTIIALGQKLKAESSNQEFKTSKAKYNFDLNYYVTNNDIFSVGVTNNQAQNSRDHMSYNFGLTHYGNRNKNKAKLYLERSYPRNERTNFRDDITLDLQNQLTKDLTMNLSLGQTYNNTLGEEERFASLKFTQAFGLAKGDFFTHEYKTDDYTSHVIGQVYLDENNNQILDEGEETVPDIKMAMDNLIATTDDQGRFEFEVIRPGMYKLDFNFNSLNANYTAIDKEKMVKIKKNENLKVNFGLTMNGSVAGRVFIDENANGKLDQDETAVNRVGLTLNDREQTTSTDDKGKFHLENIPLGKHSIKLNLDSLPKHLQPKKRDEFNIIVKKDKLDHRNLLIPLVYDFDEKE